MILCLSASDFWVNKPDLDKVFLTENGWRDDVAREEVGDRWMEEGREGGMDGPLSFSMVLKSVFCHPMIFFSINLHWRIKKG